MPAPLAPIAALVGLGWLALRGRRGAAGARTRPTTSTTPPTTSTTEDPDVPDANPDHLDPVFASTLDRVLDDLRSQGWDPVLFEGYRSAERQAQLKAAGRSTVSWSLHQYTRDGAPAALAADVISKAHGWSDDAFFASLQAAAEARGLESGNAWRWRDAAHVQAVPSSVLSSIRDGADPSPYLSRLT